jgi:Mn-dependent DtxR family transcriptional regulator
LSISILKQEEIIMEIKLANADIRNEAKRKSVRLWEIADKMGVSDQTITKRLRKELNTSEKEIYFNLIQQISAERSGAEK